MKRKQTRASIGLLVWIVIAAVAQKPRSKKESVQARDRMRLLRRDVTAPGTQQLPLPAAQQQHPAWWAGCRRAGGKGRVFQAGMELSSQLSRSLLHQRK